jgi:hypothetical protein
MSLTQFAGRFWTLSVWSFQALLHFPPFLAFLIFACLSLALAYWKQRPFQSGLWKHSHWFVLTQLLYFPVVISLGVLYPASGPSFYHAESTASRACGLLSWLSLVTAAFWVYRMKGFRWFGFGVVAVLQMILMGAFFVAGMAVSGDWL